MTKNLMERQKVFQIRKLNLIINLGRANYTPSGISKRNFSEIPDLAKINNGKINPDLIPLREGNHLQSLNDFAIANVKAKQSIYFFIIFYQFFFS